MFGPLFGPALNYLPSWQTIGTIALTVGVVAGSTALLILVPGAGPVLFAVGIASLGVTGALTAYNVGDRICNQQQNGPQAILGAVGDVTGIGSLVTGITGRDLATLRHLGLTDAQQRQLVTDGAVGTALTAAAVVGGIRGFARGRAAAAATGRGPNGRPMFADDWEALLGERYGAGNVQAVSPRNPIQGLSRVGSALKTDPFHAFPNLVDNLASGATPTALPNAALYQLEGSLNGTAGRFEWITQNGNVTHRLFVPGGTLNGVPITP